MSQTQPHANSGSAVAATKGAKSSAASGRIAWLGRNLSRARRWAARAARHPQYSVAVAKTLAGNPDVVIKALRQGPRRALLERCNATYPGTGESFSPYEAGFWGQVYFFDEYEIGALGLSGSPLVLDVGGNVGFFSWRVHDTCPGARIFAFEPEEANYSRLSRTFEAVGIKGEAVRAAVGDHEGSITLYLRNAFTHSTEASMHPEMASGTEEVGLVTLDGFLAQKAITDPVAVLKIDVEGAEVAVLRGATETLSRASAVVLEYHSAENLARCTEILTAQGFHCRPKSYWGAGVAGEGLLLCYKA